MNIVIGLGNPGEKYAHNRHNIGSMAVDLIAKKESVAFTAKSVFHAHIASSGGLLLVKPDTFMNDSGRAVAALVHQYGEPVTVVYDDIDIALGTVKCSFDRGAGGHNGIQSIIDHLGHKEFFRIRIGVRPVHEALLPRIAPPDGFEKFLLSDFTALEQKELSEGIAKAVTIIESLPHKSIEEIMNTYN